METIENQYGEEIACKTLEFKNGDWIKGVLNCHSSNGYGLGTCQCNSHSSWVADSISRNQALMLLKNYVAETEKEDKLMLQEIEWLDKAIAELN